MKRYFCTLIMLIAALGMLFVSCNNDPPLPDAEKDSITYVKDPTEGAADLIVRCTAPTADEMKKTPGDSFGTVIDDVITDSMINDEHVRNFVKVMKESFNETVASEFHTSYVDWTTMTAAAEAKLRNDLKASFDESSVTLTPNEKLVITGKKDGITYTYTHDNMRNLVITAEGNSRKAKVEYHSFKEGENVKSFFRQEITDPEWHLVYELWSGRNEEGKVNHYLLSETPTKKSETVWIWGLLDDVPDTVERNTEKDRDGNVISDTLKTTNSLIFLDMNSMIYAESDLMRNELYNWEIRMSPLTEGKYSLPESLSKLLPVNLSLVTNRLYTTDPKNDSHWIKLRENSFTWKMNVTTPFKMMQDTMITAGYPDLTYSDSKYSCEGEGWSMIIEDPYLVESNDVWITFDKEYFPAEWGF